MGDLFFLILNSPKQLEEAQSMPVGCTVVPEAPEPAGCEISTSVPKPLADALPCCISVCRTPSKLAGSACCADVGSGVVCVALVSRFVLDEPLTPRKLLGFGLMLVAMLLVTNRPAEVQT